MRISEFHSVFLAQQQRFTTDSRSLSKGDIFFALKGEHFNGNLYAEKALEQGASYVVVDEFSGVKTEQIIVVADVLKFMQELATYHRNQFTIPILAIAGSNGKTTTKELLISVLSSQYRVHATKGNFNNHIGVPITLLSMPLDTEIGLIEIGTNSFGEIAFLCNLLHPDFGLITNIGKEHLEGFGDLEGVAKEESELYHYLMRNDGFAFVNEDDVYLKRMSHRLGKKTTYSIKHTSSDLFLNVEQAAPKLNLSFGNQSITSSLSGKHNAENIAAAVAVGIHFNVPNNLIAQGIASYQPNNNRSETKRIGTNQFLLDAYNANPSSMEAAIDTFSDLKADKKVILLGDMFELGSNSLEEHRIIAQKALNQPNTTTILVGATFLQATSGLTVQTFETTQELVDHLKQQQFEDSWFLIKGSRGMKMERVLDAFS